MFIVCVCVVVDDHCVWCVVCVSSCHRIGQTSNVMVDDGCMCVCVCDGG